MESKKFMKVPKGKFDRLVYSGLIVQSVSGNKVTKEELEKEISKLNLTLDESQKKIIQENFDIKL